MTLWQDNLLDQPVTDDALVHAFATAFLVPSEAVLVITDITDPLVAVADQHLILIERRPIRGDFALQISVFLRDPEVERRGGEWPEDIKMVARLADLLACDIIMSDDSLDPSSWLLVRPTGRVDAVTLDLDDEEDDEYRLAAVHDPLPSSDERTAPLRGIARTP